MNQTLDTDTFYNLRLNFKTSEPLEVPDLLTLASGIGKALNLPEGSLMLDVRLTPLNVLPADHPMPLQELVRK